MTDFAADLRAWMDRRGLSAYAAAKAFGAKRVDTVTGWLAGKPVTFEPCIRARMAELDAGQPSARVGCFDPLGPQAETQAR